MKWQPTVLVLAAFLTLLWLAGLQPAGAPADSRSVADAAASTASGDKDQLGSQAASPGAGRAAADGSQATFRASHPAGTIHGTVVDTAGHGVPGIVVTLRKANGEDLGQNTSDARGGFVFPGIEPGEYRLAGEDPNRLYTVSDRAPVSLSPDAPAAATVRVGRGRGSVSGELRDGAGEPIASQQVEVRSRNATGFRQTVLTDARGQYHMGGLPSGQWEIDIPGLAVEPKSVEVTAASPGVASFQVVRPASLRIRIGRLLEPAPGSRGEDTVTLIPDPKTVERYAASIGSELPEEPSARREKLGQLTAELTVTDRLDADGAVAFERMFPGRYQVDAILVGGGKLGRPQDGAISLSLEEGQKYSQVLSVGDSIRGTGVHVPLWLKVVLFVVFGALFLLPLLLIPDHPALKEPPAATPAGEAT